MRGWCSATVASSSAAAARAAPVAAGWQDLAATAVTAATAAERPVAPAARVAATANQSSARRVGALTEPGGAPSLCRHPAINARYARHALAIRTNLLITAPAARPRPADGS